jgi:hypothetical protein
LPLLKKPAKDGHQARRLPHNVKSGAKELRK